MLSRRARQLTGLSATKQEYILNNYNDLEREFGDRR